MLNVETFDCTLSISESDAGLRGISLGFKLIAYNNKTALGSGSDARLLGVSFGLELIEYVTKIALGSG